MVTKAGLEGLKLLLGHEATLVEHTVHLFRGRLVALMINLSTLKLRPDCFESRRFVRLHVVGWQRGGELRIVLIGALKRLSIGVGNNGRLTGWLPVGVDRVNLLITHSLLFGQRVFLVAFVTLIRLIEPDALRAFEVLLNQLCLILQCIWWFIIIGVIVR